MAVILENPHTYAQEVKVHVREATVLTDCFQPLLICRMVLEKEEYVAMKGLGTTLLISDFTNLTRDYLKISFSKLLANLFSEKKTVS